MSTTRPLLGMRAEGSSVDPPGGRPALTVDEFTVPEDRQEELRGARPRVEQLFQVTFTIIGLLDPSGAHGSKAARQIWLQLKGKREDVSKAKEYVKGLCDPELQQIETYPSDMHCIFAGRQGLFLDGLVRDTGADVAVLESGRLRLMGGVEAVVMAQSRVQLFVSLFHSKRSLPGEREPAVKRAFKTFVEDQADNYTMELLLLPSALKEELLALARRPSPGPASTTEQDQDRSQTCTPVTDLSMRILDASFEDKAVGPPSTEVILNGRPSHKRRSSESEPRNSKRQFSSERTDSELETDFGRGARYQIPVVNLDSCECADDNDSVSPETNVKCLVNFFQTMGYQEEVVERVIRETDERQDTFLLLERIEEESQRSRANVKPSYTSCSSTSVSRGRERDRPQSQTLAETKSKENIQPNNAVMPARTPFFDTVVQQVVPMKRSQSVQGTYEVITIDDDNHIVSTSCLKPTGRMDFGATAKLDYLSRGDGQTLGPVRVETVTPLRSASHRPTQAPERPGCSYHSQTVARVPPSQPPPKVVPLTGVTRFQQSLRTPYKLTLQNEPGRTNLRHVVIDGSNVAMAHGLHRFFSCRGIAIAVQTFWKMGHREITVFVPQWRQKRDPSITEQHFLSQLEDLRLLSFTPSREVCGQRISSHDDRFMLHLAEKTGGVIVSNDNLRDFVDTSDAWRKIIKERLLQFTFVEDHFMIPDDPLGKNGPRLEEFLRKDYSCSAVAVPVWSELRATPSVQVKVPHSAQLPSFTPQMRPPSQWPHTGPPEWHLPRPSPSPPPQRSPSETSELKKQLYDIFPDQKQRIDRILGDNPYMRDLNALSGLLLG